MFSVLNYAEAGAPQVYMGSEAVVVNNDQLGHSHSQMVEIPLADYPENPQNFQQRKMSTSSQL